MGLGPHLEFETSVKFTIPLPLIGQVIGKNGSFVQNILQKFGAVIKIMQDAPSPSVTVDERPLAITGQIDGLLQAQELLLQRIEHAAANYSGEIGMMDSELLLFVTILDLFHSRRALSNAHATTTRACT